MTHDISTASQRPTTRIEGGRRLRQAARATPPLVSIISVVFRARQELPSLLESIIALRDDYTELIVIDGGSDDGSIDILRHFDNSIDYWISEADRGIYDAMNKGIAVATGKFVLHINAGDRLLFIPRQELDQSLADNIDVACARSRGIVVTNTPDVLTESVADFTWAMILAVTRRL